jgi:hypothetical protein
MKVAKALLVAAALLGFTQIAECPTQNDFI